MLSCLDRKNRSSILISKSKEKLVILKIIKIIATSGVIRIVKAKIRITARIGKIT
jgi:hypothetical protein